PSGRPWAPASSRSPRPVPAPAAIVNDRGSAVVQPPPAAGQVQPEQLLAAARAGGQRHGLSHRVETGFPVQPRGHVVAVHNPQENGPDLGRLQTVEDHAEKLEPDPRAPPAGADPQILQEALVRGPARLAGRAQQAYRQAVHEPYVPAPPAELGPPP